MNRKKPRQLLSVLAFLLLFLVGCNSTQEKIQPTEEIPDPNKGRVEGIITSADGTGKPLPDVLIQLKSHPLLYENTSIEAIAATKTDSQGRYVFTNIEPGVYYPHTTIFLPQGGSCSIADMSTFIELEAGKAEIVNLSYLCTPEGFESSP